MTDKIKCYRCKNEVPRDMCLNCGMMKLDSEIYYEKDDELNNEGVV